MSFWFRLFKIIANCLHHSFQFIVHDEPVPSMFAYFVRILASQFTKRKRAISANLCDTAYAGLQRLQLDVGYFQEKVLHINHFTGFVK